MRRGFQHKGADVPAATRTNPKTTQKRTYILDVVIISSWSQGVLLSVCHYLGYIVAALRRELYAAARAPSATA